jgi:membrane-associated protease RseP (regulator of RpoE activity)
LHLGLFAATVASTLFVGYLMSGNLWQAAGYSGAIMSILLLHEMGHYVMCLRYRVPATLPYFIPVPLPPFGTMGAVIRMKGLLKSRRSVFDVGVAGPLVGLAAAVPITCWGLRISEVVEHGEMATGGWRLGESLLFSLLVRTSLGAVPADADILLHPVAMAGWAGLFVTGLNLLPIGQLDGGHILYGMLGRRARWVGLALIGLLGVLTLFYHRAWWPLLMLLLFVGPGHPPVPVSGPLDRQRMLLGFLVMALFLATFVPRPIVLEMP